MKINFSPVYSFFVVFVMMNGISACHSSNSKILSTPTSGHIRISADETFKPVLDAEIQVFEALYPYAQIEVEYKTETEALNDLLKDSTNLVISSRKLRNEETEYFNNKKLFPKELSIAKDGIALIVNRNNTDTLLNLESIKAILTGKIIHWKEVNPNSNLGDLRMVFDNKNSSTVRFVIDSICKGLEISPTHSAVRKNSEVIEAVVNNKSLIGVIGVSWISDRDDSTQLSFLNKIRVVSISTNHHPTIENSYKPYQAYMAEGWYPLTREIYVISTEPRVGLATGFAAFLASERGQRIILKTGILPTTQPYRIIEVKDHF